MFLPLLCLVVGLVVGMVAESLTGLVSKWRGKPEDGPPPPPPPKMKPMDGPPNPPPPINKP